MDFGSEAARAGIIAIGFAVPAIASATQTISAAAVSNFSTSMGLGDVTVTMSLPVTGCDALWLRKADEGFGSAYAAIMLAKANGMTATVVVDETSWWPGSPSGHFCRILAFRVD